MQDRKYTVSSAVSYTYINDHIKINPVKTYQKDEADCACKDTNLNLTDVRYMQLRILLLLGQKRASDGDGILQP